MPHLLLVENALSPTSRSVKQIGSLLRRGWKVSLVLREGGQPGEAVGTEALDIRSPDGHPLVLRTREQLRSATEALSVSKAELEQAAERVRATPRTDVEQWERLRRDSAAVRAATDACGAEVRALRAEISAPTPYTSPFTFGDPLRLHSWWSEAARVIASADCDVVHCADLDALPAAIWGATAARRPAPVLYDAHELFPELSYLPDVHRAFWDSLASSFVPRADSVLTVSQAIADRLRSRYGARRVTTVLNMPVVGKAHGSEIRSRLGLEIGSPLAVHVGTTARNRELGRVPPLLAALPALHVALLGGGPADHRLELVHRARELGVEGRLHLLAPVPGPELVSYLRSADLGLVLYTAAGGDHLRFTLPNKLFDALAAGLPVVASSDTSCGWYCLEHGCGVAFQPDRSDSLAAAVLEVLAAPRYRRQAERLAGSCTWDAVEHVYVAEVSALADRHEQG